MAEAVSVAELTDEWIALLQKSGEEEALDFYCERIIPPLLPILRDKFRSFYEHDPHYDGLISLLGFAPDTVILAYQFIEPENLVVIHTKETKHFLDTVYKYARVPVASFYHEMFEEIPNTDIYRALEAALKRFPKGSKIAIELTGGKKTMSGALAIASGLLDIDLLYIDYSKYIPEFRKPRAESTYIHLVGNPLKLPVDLFAEVEITRAVNFFNVGKYDVSRTLFEQARQRMSNPRVAEVCSDLSQLYLLWNILSFQDAFELSQSLFEKIIHFSGQISTIFQFNIEQYKRQVETLRQLSAGNRTYLLWNFYFSAERYEKNNQNDIAALLYYRTIESVFENSLKDISEEFDGEHPEYSLFRKDINELQEKFIEYRRNAIGKGDFVGESLPRQVAMFDALCLLGALDQPIANKINSRRVANIAKIRNRSVYAHGIRPIDPQSVSDIRKLATDILQFYIDIAQIDSVDVQRSNFEFMELVIRKKD